MAMVSIIYNIVMRLGAWGQAIVGTFNGKVAGRHEQLRKQYGELKNSGLGERRILFHCASYGELEQAIPLIKRIKASHPALSIIVSFFSPSGFNNAHKYDDLDAICYLPIDTPSRMTEFVREIRPQSVFIIKYEIWLNFLRSLNSQQIPVFLISARFYKNQLYFKWYGKILLKSIANIDCICVQDANSQKLLDAYGISSYLTGDTRADRVIERRQQVNHELESIATWSENRRVLILGSIWPEDWAVFEPEIESITLDYKLIIAPHEMNAEFMIRMENSMSKPVYRWTENNAEKMLTSEIIILDTIGLLADCYRYGSVAYIGGAFHQGLHNILEPAAYGLPVVFGPRTAKFGEASDLIEREAAFKISDATTLSRVLASLKNDAYRQGCGSRAASYIEEAAGSSEKIHKLWTDFIA